MSAVELPESFMEALAERVAERLQPRPRLLSKSALSDYLGVKPRTIETWRSKGAPGYRVGREVMYPVVDVERWIEREAE